MDRFVDTRPLRSSPAFRRLWFGSTASAFGGQLTVVAVLFQTWELTRSPLWVGAIGLFHAVPMIIFGLLGGTLADAVDRRLLVIVSTSGAMVVALLLAVQSFGSAPSAAVVLGLVAISAVCTSIGAPARKTFVATTLHRDQIAAGVALSHLGFQGALLAGPAVAGLVIAGWGLPVCYLLDALTFALAMYGIARLPRGRVDDAGRAGLAEILAGWRYIAHRPALHGSFLTDLAATVLAMPVALFPMINAERFGGRPETLGIFLSAIAVGGIAAGLLSGLVTRARRAGSVQLVAAAVWGVALAGFGLAGPLWLALGCLVLAGAADTVSVISRGAVVQLDTAERYRGRVSSVEQIVGTGGPELGNVRGGLLAAMTSASVALAAGGLLCVAAVALITATNPTLRRFTTTASVEQPERV
ncbi:MAG: MFS transporter [Nakamurella sp.]